MTITVPVALGNRSYRIHIGPGALSRAGEFLRTIAGGAETTRPLPVVTDQTVANLHYPALAASLKAAGFGPTPIVLPPGEQTKSYSYLQSLVDQLLSLGIERDGLIIAFGGGVVGDLAGFAAGIVKRGIDYVQVPTTLLAQVDSSVGGKTAIDTEHGKNMVGVFHQPRVVIADTDVLQTLPRREFLGGFAEIAKYGLLGDAEFFAWLETNGSAVLAGDARAICHAVAHSCAMKADIVARDELETGDRALLNLGHTFGHALEAWTGYSGQLIHGEAVALGCALAFKLSARLGHCPSSDAARAADFLKAAGFPVDIAAIPGPGPAPDTILDFMRHDKKAKGGRMTFILAKGIGKAFIARDVPEEAVRRLFAED